LYEPLVDDDPDSKVLLVWIFHRDLSGILPTLPALLFFTVAVIPGYIKREFGEQPLQVEDCSFRYMQFWV
jgi:hypothetical protein